MDVNNSAMAGTIAIGCGHAQLQELCAALDLPLISPTVFQKHQNTIAANWEKAATESMFKAAEEEKRLSIQEGRVNKEGVPVIDVIADGCWSKRSYKKKLLCFVRSRRNNWQTYRKNFVPRNKK